MTRGTGKRIYRACERCRRLKTRCELGQIGEPQVPPCVSCHRSASECVLAGSRRGGNFRSGRRARGARTIPSPRNGGGEADAPGTGRQGATSDQEHAALSLDEDEDMMADGGALVGETSGEEMRTELRNPSDALHILATSTDAPKDVPSGKMTALASPAALRRGGAVKTRRGDLVRSSDSATAQALDAYEPIAAGRLTTWNLSELLRRYSELYHPYLPIAPIYMVQPVAIEKIQQADFFLLTVLLTIASRDQPEYAPTHRYCWEYAKRLLLDVLLASPWTQTTRTVESLLLLSEWLPQVQPTGVTSELSNGSSLLSEDRTAWSLIGQAVRHAYMLGLDLGAFPDDGAGRTKKENNRRRLVWAYVYVADRQISIRLGQSFWSRGPALSTKLTAKDFATLQPRKDGDEDFASALEAKIELTQIMHNAHSVLYSSRARTRALVVSGDYSRYLDDFQIAATAWKQSSGGISVAPRTRRALLLLYEYLCLYVNSFALQAVITRETSQRGPRPPGAADQPTTGAPFHRGVMSSPDGGFIFDAFNAALNLLRTMVGMSPETELRFLPTKYHLYAVYAAVFLCRASTVGAVTTKTQQQETNDLILEFATALEASSPSEAHVSKRYSKMLKTLWMQHRPKATALSPSVVPGANQSLDTASAFIAMDPDEYMLENQADQIFGPSQPFWTNDMLIQELNGVASEFQNASFSDSLLSGYLGFPNPLP